MPPHLFGQSVMKIMMKKKKHDRVTLIQSLNNTCVRLFFEKLVPDSQPSELTTFKEGKFKIEPLC